MGKKIWLSMRPRIFGSDFKSSYCAPARPHHAYQCEITQSTGMPTQTQRLATSYFFSRPVA